MNYDQIFSEPENKDQSRILVNQRRIYYFNELRFFFDEPRFYFDELIPTFSDSLNI